MFFTLEDYKKIHDWIRSNSIKDTEFNNANTPLKDTDTITLVLNNTNVRVSLKDFTDQLFLMGVSDFLNISHKYGEYYITLLQAIELIPYNSRKRGQVITFLDEHENWRIYLFRGEINQWSILHEWLDILDFEPYIINSILPDEEDLTKTKPDLVGNTYLSLKDREYNPEDFSGMGRIILRKNIVEIEDPIYGKVKKNILYQDMFTQSNTVYECRYDFDLNGKDITLPNNSYIEYNGGSISNGNIIDIAKGLNRIILRKNIEDGKNILTQDMINKENTIYEIRYDFDLNGEKVTIPEGCVLDFQGGSLNNGNIIGTNTYIVEQPNSMKVLLGGSISNRELHCSTFGINPNEKADICTSRLMSLLNISSMLNTEKLTIYWDWNGNIEFTETLNIPPYTTIIGNGVTTNLTKTVDDSNEIDAVIKFRGRGVFIDSIHLWNGKSSQYGIYAEKANSSKISNVQLLGYKIGIHLKICWLTSLEDILCQGCNIGVHYQEGTSINSTRVYIHSQKKYGIVCSNLVYSTFINCANDHAVEGVGVSASGTNASFVNCGMESNLITRCYNFERCQINILGGNYNTFETDIPENYEPTGEEAIIQTFSTKLSVIGAIFGTSTHSSLQTIVKDTTSGNEFPSEIELDVNYFKNGYKNPIKINNGYAVIHVNGVDGKYYTTNFQNLHYIGDNKNIKINVNSKHKTIDENILRKDNIGTVYFPTDTYKKMYHASVDLWDKSYYIGNVVSIDMELGHYILKIKGRSDTVCNKSGFLKSNDYLLRIGNNYAFATEAKFDDKDVKNIYYKISNDSALNINVNDKVDAFRYAEPSNIKSIKATNTGYTIIFNSLMKNSTIVPNINFSIIGINSSEDVPLFINKIKSVTPSNRSISILNSDIVQGTLKETTKLYFIIDKKERKYYPSARVPFIVYNQLEAIKDMNAVGAIAGGQTSFSIDSKELLVNREGELYSVQMYPENRKFFGGHGSRPDSPFEGEFYYDWDYVKPTWYINGKWIDPQGNDENQKVYGSTNYRPSNVRLGTCYFDSDWGKPIWWNGTDWITSNGEKTNRFSGTFIEKPTSESIYVGFAYFCTDRQTTEGTTDGIMIYHKGNNIWVDALGRVVT